MLFSKAHRRKLLPESPKHNLKFYFARLLRDAMLCVLSRVISSMGVSKCGRKIFSDRFFDKNLENNPNPKIRDDSCFMIGNLYYLSYIRCFLVLSYHKIKISNKYLINRCLCDTCGCYN